MIIGMSQSSFAFSSASEEPENRHFNQEQLEEFRQDQDFRYENITPIKDSIWDKILYYINQLLKLIFSDKGAVPYIRYAVLAAIVVVSIIYLTGGKFQWFWGKETKTKNGIVSLVQEDITQIDLDTLANQALQNGDFRLSIRYRYLHLLKILNEKEYIEWHKDKTNLDYLREIKSPEIKAQFKQNTLVFDYVWYGQFQLDAIQFQTIHHGFQQLIQSLQNGTAK